jgi:two-component system chemotaxis sensor kinase CheA
MADDPLKYFRIEAQELVAALTRGLLDLERSSGGDAIDQCFRSAHTLKGAARVVKQLRIGEIAHSIEDALAPYRDSKVPLPGEDVGRLLRLVEAIRDELAVLDPPRFPSERGLRRAADEERFETARVPIAEMDELLDGIGEATIQIGALRGGIDALGTAERLSVGLAREIASRGEFRGKEFRGGELGPRGRAEGERPEDAARRAISSSMAEELRGHLARVRHEFASSIALIERELRLANERLRELRLVPASAVLGPLDLAVRDASEALGKRVQFETTGGDIRLDGHILGVLRDALLHMVRNAVDHGIEPSPERALAGKPAVGRVHLKVERRGGRVAFICSDDGRGVDIAALRRAAVRSGVYSEIRADELSASEALPLIFRAGVSTRDVVTPISGRGVGLDVVREMAAKLKGQVRAESEPGRGTVVEIVVPVSLTALTALTLESGGLSALLPIDAVRSVLRLSEGDLERGEEGSYIFFEDAPVPFAPLSILLGASEGDVGVPRSAVIVGADSGGRLGGIVALGTDRLLGTADVIVKPLPAAVGAAPLIVGAAFNKSGDPLLMLDPAGLWDAVRKVRAFRISAHAGAKRVPVLVIDDSLTTRMLEQSILGSEGYEVDLAASGEEGLRKAGGRRYGLIIVDVEMPGMNGFEFAERVRADPALASVPLMMVTSFASADARERAARTGVQAFIVKGEFDQRAFIGKVAELLQRSAVEAP